MIKCTGVSRVIKEEREIEIEIERKQPVTLTSSLREENNKVYKCLRGIMVIKKERNRDR